MTVIIIIKGYGDLNLMTVIQPLFMSTVYGMLNE